jgi:hypothetical protein
LPVVPPIDELANFAVCDFGRFFSQARTVCHSSSEGEPRLHTDQFLKFIYAQLLALKTIQSLQFFGRRNVFQHFDTLILRRAAGVMG